MSSTKRSNVLAFVFVVLIFASPSVVSSQALRPTGPATTAAAQAPNSPTGQQNAQTSPQGRSPQDAEKIKSALQKALGTLIPGGIPDNSPRSQSFTNAIELFAAGKVKESMAELQRLAASDRELPPADIMMAGLSFAVGDNKSGIGILEKSSIEFPTHPSVFLSFAQLAINDGRVTDAQVQIEKSAGLIDGGNFTPAQQTFYRTKYFELLAGVQIRRRQYDQANASLERMQQVAPDQPSYHLAMAELKFKQNDDYEGALESLQKYADVSKQTKKPVLTLVEWLIQSDKPELANKWMNSAVRKNPTNLEVQLAGAQLALAQEDFASSQISIRNYEKVKGETFVSKSMKGRIAFAQQSYDTAESHYQVLHEKSPSNINYANVYALCLIESNDEEKRKMAKAISLSVAKSMPDNPLALGTLGYIHMKLGEMEQASALIGRVARGPNVNPEVSYFVAQFLNRTGRTQAAQSVLEKTLAFKGLFIYRSAARDLLNEIKNGSGGLPAPQNDQK